MKLKNKLTAFTLIALGLAFAYTYFPSNKPIEVTRHWCNGSFQAGACDE